MALSFSGVVTWAHRRRALVFIGAGCLVAASFIGLQQLRLDANVLRLLPSSGRPLQAFRTFLERFGTLDDLYVIFSAPEGDAIADYDDQISNWVAALRAAPELAHVDSGHVDTSRDWSWLAERELMLLDEGSLSQVLARLQPAAMPALLASTRELLAIPSPEIAALIKDDPFGVHDLLRRQLSGAEMVLPIGSTDRGYLSRDGRQRLVVARPVFPPYDTAFAHALFERLRAIEREQAQHVGTGGEDVRPPLTVEFAGGHRIAIEAEAVVRRESIVNGIGSLALILPLLFLVFRSPSLVLIGAMPSAVALLIVLGVLGLAGATLSAAATGASAMLFGLGVDGVVLLYVAYRNALARGLDPQRAIGALAAPSASMLLGMWTTAATFLGLIVVDFPSLEQLGLLIGLSMVVCGALTLVMVPASLPAYPPRRLPTPLTMPRVADAVLHHRRGILGVAVIVTLILGYFATTLRVNPTLERLRSVTKGAVLLEEVTQAFGLPSDIFVALAEGADLETLLTADEALAAAIRRIAPDVGLQAASALLPSQRAQTARKKTIRAGVPDIDTVTSGLEQSALAAGFLPRTFDQFIARLPRMIDPDSALTWEGFMTHGLGDVVGRFVARTENGWVLASYVFPKTPEQIAAIHDAVAAAGGGTVLTGIPIVNSELSAQFVPQFLRGLGVGTAVVLTLVFATFRDVRLTLLTMVPTALGLLWAAGLLGAAGFELDLFSVFAVISFVGIGVDYGVHLVHHYRDGQNIHKAVSELCPVILLAGGITLLGYGTLIGSGYPPLRSIGVVSVVSALALVAASVLVLPGLLQGRRV